MPLRLPVGQEDDGHTLHFAVWMGDHQAVTWRRVGVPRRGMTPTHLSPHDLPRTLRTLYWRVSCSPPYGLVSRGVITVSLTKEDG